MADLNGQTIAATYSSLLKFDDNGTVETDTVQVISDGRGTDTSLSLSTQRATITLGTGAADDFIVRSGSTNVLLVEGDANDTGPGAINKVGIGTSTPQAVLSVTGASDVSPDYGLFQITTGTGAAATSKLTFGVKTEDYAYIQSVKTGVQPYKLILQPSGGYVGIGTTSPSSLLTVDAPGGGVLEFRRDDADQSMGSSDVMGIIDFTADGFEAGTFEPGGRIACVAHSGWAENHHPSRMDFYVNGGSSGAAITDHLKMRIDNLGNILVGVNALPGNAHTAVCILDGNDPAVATANTSCFFSTGGTMRVTDAAGNTGTISYSSDERVKDNITVIPNALSRLADLKGVTFNYVSFKDSSLPYKDNIADDVTHPEFDSYGNNIRVGIIAQDVEKAYDGLNITNAVLEGVVESSVQADTQEVYGKLKKTRDMALIPLLIEAVKELSTKVTALENA
jgi:hypothetical protein